MVVWLLCWLVVCTVGCLVDLVDGVDWMSDWLVFLFFVCLFVSLDFYMAG